MGADFWSGPRPGPGPGGRRWIYMGRRYFSSQWDPGIQKPTLLGAKILPRASCSSSSSSSPPPFPSPSQPSPAHPLNSSGSAPREFSPTPSSIRRKPLLECLKKKDEERREERGGGVLGEKQVSHSSFRYFFLLFLIMTHIIQYKVLGPETGLPGHKIYIHSWT